MNRALKALAQPIPLALAICALYPLWLAPDQWLFQLTGIRFSEQLAYIFIYAVLALGLNVVVGYTGLLHLGIAAFFGIGAYIAGIATVPAFPFQVGFFWSVALAMAGAALAGVLLSAPALRLRGDYLAIVTLGFGEVVLVALKKLESVTAGSRGLNPVPQPAMPQAVRSLFEGLDLPAPQAWMYYLTLGFLSLTLLLLSNLERSRLGRAWIAVREDELAASCMGINTARVKLSALALGAAIAGLAGCLYATTLTSTANPDAYSFSRSITTLCCVILGGLGSLRGTLLGVLLLVGFDNVLSPIIDGWVQRIDPNPEAIPWRTFSNWRLMVFGLALILMMRFRPEGLLPSRRVQLEVHSETPATLGGQ